MGKKPAGPDTVGGRGVGAVGVGGEEDHTHRPGLHPQPVREGKTVAIGQPDVDANQHQPWLMFESGALAKHLAFARVIPLCIDIETTGIAGPLADWQARKLDREGMQRVVSDINSATPKPLPKESLKKLFDLTWPGFEEAVNIAKERLPETRQPGRQDREILEELLERVRRIERVRNSDSDTRTLLRWVQNLSPDELNWMRVALHRTLQEGGDLNAGAAARSAEVLNGLKYLNHEYHSEQGAPPETDS